MKKLLLIAILLCSFSALALDEAKVKELATEAQVNIVSVVMNEKSIQIIGGSKTYKGIGAFIQSLKKSGKCKDVNYAKPKAKKDMALGKNAFEINCLFK